MSVAEGPNALDRELVDPGHDDFEVRGNSSDAMLRLQVVGVRARTANLRASYVMGGKLDACRVCLFVAVWKT